MNKPIREVWYVAGADPAQQWPVLWATKMDAEIYARDKFPEETPDARYARIYYRNVNTFEGGGREHA